MLLGKVNKINKLDKRMERFDFTDNVINMFVGSLEIYLSITSNKLST